MQGFNINQVATPPTVVQGQVVPPTGGGGWATNCQPGLDGTTPDADFFNDLVGNLLRVLQAGDVVPTPDRYDDLLEAISALIGSSVTAASSNLSGQIAAAIPSGVILPFGGSSIPTGFLLANGAAVSRTAYVALFETIGATYGGGDGATTFNLPDSRGVVLRGFDNGRGLDPGRTLGSYQADGYESHVHPANDPGHAHGVADPEHVHPVADPGHMHTTVTGSMAAGNSGPGGSLSAPGNNTAVGITSSGSGTGISIAGSGTGIGIYGSSTGVTVQASGGAETRGKNLAVNFIIKY